MKPRVLFVSRERFELPLTGAQKRKWDAVGATVEPRILAAARRGRPTRDERFRLVAQIRPKVLDGPLYYLLLPARIARELRDFRPEAALVQGVHETVAFLIARRFARANTRVILDVQGDWRGATRLYGSPLRRLLNPISDALAPLAVRRADAVRTVSVETTILVRELGVEPAATFPSYVDAAAFLVPPLAPLPKRPAALFVGALERVKGFDTLAAAWPRVQARVPDASLSIVGRGALAPLARALAAEWHEQISAESVAAAMDESWLLVLPSRSEGLPRVAVEAACRGRAVIGGRRGGIPDVVRDGENGRLVDPEDAGALADALVDVLADRGEAERLGAAARRTGEEWGITADEYAAKVLALVRSTLA